MLDDKVNEATLAAIKQGLAEPGEQRLFRSGKLAGLYPGRNRVNTAAAAEAVRQGLLEIVRTETKGKLYTDWVRVTPKGIEFLVSRESPARAMDELRAALQATQEGIPLWLAQIRQTLNELGKRLTEEAQRIRHRLEKLSERVEEGLKRAQETSPRLPETATAAFPWALDAVAYLDRRKQSGIASTCPLPELFTGLSEKEGSLTLSTFHAGLRHLHDRGLVRLLTFQGPGELPEPEYALLDGPSVFYYAAR